MRPSVVSRLFVSAVCVLALAACSPPSEAPPPAAPPSGPVVAQADSLAARLVPGALASAFERLAAMGYRATVTVDELDASGAVVGSFRRDLVHTPPDTLQVVSTQASGTLADTSGISPARLQLTDPIPPVLTDPPPYLSASTRDQYTTALGASRGTVHTVTVAHSTATDQAVQRVEGAVDTATGDVLRFVVERSSGSAIYDEDARADVRLVATPGGLVPGYVETRSTVDTPLAGVHTYRVVWRITPAD